MSCARPEIRLFGISAAFLVLGACAGTNTLPSPDATSDVDLSANEYIIGPGDSLSIFVWRNEDLTTDIQVRPDGRISIPLVDDMQAVGKTPSILATDIEQALGQYIRTPDVTVMVTSFGVGAFDNQIRIVGAGAGTPQVIPYRQGITLLDVMIEVGLSEFAAGDRARLVRRTNGDLVETRVRLSRLVNRGDLSQNLALSPGDVLIIPEARF